MELPRIRFGAPGFHEWAVAAALAGTADERKAFARAWNDANCA